MPLPSFLVKKKKAQKLGPFFALLANSCSRIYTKIKRNFIEFFYSEKASIGIFLRKTNHYALISFLYKTFYSFFMAQNNQNFSNQERNYSTQESRTPIPPPPPPPPPLSRSEFPKLVDHPVVDLTSSQPRSLGRTELFENRFLMGFITGAPFMGIFSLLALFIILFNPYPYPL